MHAHAQSLPISREEIEQSHTEREATDSRGSADDVALRRLIPRTTAQPAHLQHSTVQSSCTRDSEKSVHKCGGECDGRRV